ncbi:MAG: cyclic nucleotide-binding domain-containing protein [Bdellovibrionales bacterium]|nr:cyclic nucleotide-binding domain-containing protein [Bdellovibrionales bacterium]
MLEVFFENFFKKEIDSEIKIIKKCPLFSKLTRKELSFVKSLLHSRIYVDGETVFKSSVGTGMYIILKGEVSILKGNPNSENTTLISTLKTGQFFGELALVDKEAYKNMFAQSAGNSKLLAFFQSDFSLILDNHPKIGVKILSQICEILSHRLKKAEHHILQIDSNK